MKMKIMLLVAGLLGLAISPAQAQTSTETQPVVSVLPQSKNAEAKQLKGYHIEIILDVSGSMSDVIDGQRKIDIAKRAIEEMLVEIPESAQLAFRAYGHRHLPEQQQCQDTELLFPFSTASRDKIAQALRPLQPRGLTPIEFSLRQAWNDFPAASEFGKMIILVSDGEETCAGDPCAAVKAMRASGVDVQVNAIGFDVNKVAEGQLRCIADATGGEYRKASNSQDLIEGLKAMARRAKISYESDAEDIKAGTGFSNAPLIKPGEFGNKILGDEMHFFKLKVTKGQNLVAVLRGRSEKPVVSRHYGPSTDFSVSLFDKYKRPLKKSANNLNSQYADFSTASIEVPMKKSQVVYLQVTRPPGKVGSGGDAAERTKKWDRSFVMYELGVFLEDPEEEVKD